MSHANTDKGRGRIYWVDALRAVGIVFVVIGHTNGIGRYLDHYIFSFHMPLFFFVSGFLIKESDLQKKPGAFLHGHFRALLVPYLFFGLLSYLPWYFFTRHLGADALLSIDPIKPLIGMAYGIGVDGWLQHNAMLWFFPCLFVVHGLFYTMLSVLRRTQLIFAIIASGVVGYLISVGHIPRLPWGADIAFSALVFYGLGFILKERIAAFAPGRLTTVAFLLLFCGIQLIAISANGRVDMNFLTFGNPLWFYVGAMSGIAFWVVICKRLPRIDWLATVGAETVVIFPLHRVVFSLITGVAVYGLHIEGDFKSHFIASVVYTTLTIALLMPVAQHLRKYIPWAVGQKAGRHG